jgi:Polyketide cyclase / dehydrase and lipid transport
LPRFVWALGPIPGVASAALLGAAPQGVGSVRHLVMTDGSAVDEHVLVYDPGSNFTYRWGGPPAPPFSLLVRGAEASWTFTPSGTGTVVGWTYRMELTTPLVYPLAAAVRTLFRRWMAAALDRLAAL